MKLNQFLFLILSITGFSVLGQSKTGVHKMHSNIKSLLEASSIAKTAESKFIDRSVIKKQGKVLLEITAQNELENTVTALNNLGIKIKAKSGRKVSAWVFLNQLEAIANLQEVRWVQGVNMAAANGGIGSTETTSVEQDGFSAIFENYGILGEDVTIGVISTSYNNQNGEADGITSGDLPGVGNPNGYIKPVVIVEEATEDVTDDEGRAMIEIMHDLAPAADYLFITGLNGRVSYAESIGRLVDAGADVVVSDINYVNSPFYLDGLVAKAFDAAFEQGIPVVQHAGNFRTNAYESQFVNSDSLFMGEVAHDFDPGPGVDIAQTISIPSRFGRFSLQWDDPWFSENGVGTDTDMSVHFLDGTGAFLATVSDDNIQSGDPEQLVIFTDIPVTTLQMIITKRAGPDPGMIKYLLSDPSTIDEYATNSPTILGTQNSKTIISVGGNFQSNPTERYFFSSIGGAQILFDNDGNRLAEPLIRNLPTLMAPQGVNTTFFGLTGEADVEADGFPNFFGTSASAPHIAALAALMLECNNEYTPTEIKELLINTASDFEAPGFDFNTGYGYWNPEEVLKTCVDENEPVDPDPVDPIDFVCKNEYIFIEPIVVNIRSNSAFVIAPSLFGSEVQIKKSEEENWTTIEGYGSIFRLNDLEACTKYEVRNAYYCNLEPAFSEVVTFETAGCNNECEDYDIQLNKLADYGTGLVLNWDYIPQKTYQLQYRTIDQNNWNIYETRAPIAIIYALNTCSTYEFKVSIICDNNVLSAESNIVTLETGNCKTASDDLVKNETFKIYPTIANDYIGIVTNSSKNISEINIYDLAGKLVKTINPKATTTSINELSSGAYIVNAILNDKVLSTKFIKK